MKLHHPDLDATIELPDGAPRHVYERSGWVLAPEPEPEVPHVPEGSQLLPDTPPDPDTPPEAGDESDDKTKRRPRAGS